MMEIKLVFEFDEEQMRDMFEEAEIKFSKKKVNELKDEIDLSGASTDFAEGVVDEVRDFIIEYLTDLFEK